MHSILLIALLISTSTFAKVQTNWGKMYDITKDNTNNDIPLPTADVTVYLNTYFQQIILDIASNQSSSNIYTIVFPARDYIVSNTVTFSLALYSSINNATINFIGLKSSYVNGYFKNLSVVDQEAYINAHYASTNIICNNDPSSSNYLNYQSKDLMPKFIYTPTTPTNVNMFEFINSVNNITLANNTCNIMGLEIQGEAFNNWSYLQPHPYFNTMNCKGLLDLAFWANAYVDNNYLHDHYGRGISTQLDPSSLFYRNKDVVISNNVIENVYAFLPGTLANGANDNCGDGINLMGIHGAIIKNNYVFNDLNITGMCGRLGIGGDAFQYCTIEGNVVNGYNRDIHIESGSGNNIVAKNRLTGTYCGILSQGNVNPNPIIGNYIATKNIPNLTLNTWGGALGYTLSSALSWAYGFGLINYMPDNNLPLPIVGNTLYIDVNAGGSPSSAPGSYFYIHSNKNNIDLMCNEFNSNTGSFGLFIGGALHSLQSNSFNNIRPITINWSALNTNNTFANSFINNCDPIIYNGTPSFNLSNPSTSNSCFQLFANTTYNCNAPTAQINFTAIGGVAPINYSINGSAQSSPFIAASGSYTIVATDANSNTTSTNITITLPTPLALSIATTNVPCYNGNNGTAISTVTGSVSPYHYFWTDNTGNLISNQTIYDDAALHLIQGNYTLTVTDAIGCTATNSFSITQPAMQNTANIIAQTSVLCQGGMGGSATVAVAPSNNSYTYSWSTTPVQTTATATNLAAGTYTATVTNGGYCAQTTVTIAGLSLSATAGAIACNGGSTNVKLTTSGGVGTITTTPANTYLTAGTYTFTATDTYNNCTATTIATINAAPSSISIALTNVTQPLCNGTTGSIAFTTSGGTGAIAVINNSALVGAIPVTSPVSSLSAATYTLSATDANSCIVTTTYIINASLTASATISDISCAGSADGSIQLTAAGGTPGYSYNWSNAAATQNLTNLSAGTYSCTITDANGCTTNVNNLTINAPSGAYCCNTNFTNYPTHLLADNINSSSLAQSTYSNTAIMVNGIFTIDNNLTLNNCQLYFTPNAKIQLSATYTLTLNTCTLQAGCSAMWDGIYANDPTEQIVLNNCTISDMENGVLLQNQAKVQAIGNTFTNNYLCMHFFNIVGPYNSTLGNCIVRQNTFTSTGGSTMLLPPHNNQNRTETGIRIFWCSEVQIGYIDANAPDPTDKNVFENIYNGIEVITSNNATYSHKPLLYNNDFTNIHNDAIGTGVAQQNLNMLNSIFTTHRGAGIYVKDFSLAPQILTDIHYLTVNNVPDDVNPAKFSSCDKAIVTTKMGADIRNTNVQDTKFGFMHTEADGQNYWIGDQSNDNLRTDANNLTNVHYGIDVNGLNSRIHINDNIIVTNPAPLITTLANVYPRGIHVDELINYSKIINGNTEYAWQTELRQNKITLPSSLGKGIQLSNCGESSIIERDSVLLTNNIKVPKYEYLGGNDYTGIQLDNVTQSTLLGNHVFGPSTTGIANTAKTTSAIKLITSPYNTYECNHIQNTKYGWWVQDDCHTSNTSDLKNNDWNHHYYGMLFTPLGVDGTLGNLGEDITNYNYNFVGNYDNDANQADADRLFRIIDPNASAVATYTIYANDPSISTSITQAQSGSNVPGFEYFPFPTNNLIPACDPTYSIVAGGGGSGEEIVDEQNAMLLVHDSVSFYANPAVAEWLAQMKLYKGLDVDSATRLGNLTLNTFYNNLKYQNIGYINNANRKIVALVSQDNLADSTVFAEALLDAKNTNEQNQNGALYEDKERIINTIYFKTIEYGSSSWSEEEAIQVEALAKSCPLINGSAVYKARTLWHTMQPWIDYDDLNICNNTGQNKKSAENPFDFVLDNLENGKDSNQNTFANIPPNNEFGKVNFEIKKININSNFSLSPNPAQSQITIKYKLEPWQTAKIIIYDAIGAEVQSIELPNFVETLTTSLNNISNGTYTYKYIVDGATVTTNKLIVIK